MPSKYNDPDRLDAQARETAIDVLTWLAGEPDLMTRYLSLTGQTADTLRNSASDPGFYVGILDFLMNHEPTLLAYCDSSGTPPQQVVRAHAVLTGHPGHDTNG